jgi:hypothetical protein|tara:strand:+ start:5174 stop:5440 length:267 start_codon:yes stop_codon:yes gene_type:complete
MKIDDIIASIALGLGFVQIYDNFNRSDEVGEESKHMLLLGIITTSLWLTYQSRRYGLNLLTVNTSIALAVQVYVMSRIYKNKLIWFKG